MDIRKQITDRVIDSIVDDIIWLRNAGECDNDILVFDGRQGDWGECSASSRSVVEEIIDEWGDSADGATVDDLPTAEEWLDEIANVDMLSTTHIHMLSQ